VAPTNFGGYDEWLIVHLTSVGRFSIPYASRPLELFWDLPAPLLFPHRLEAFLWLHAAYLWLVGVIVWASLRRLVPGARLYAFFAGAFAAAWAPGDSLRLNAVETVAYSGVTFVALAAGVVLWTAWARGSRALFAAAALLAVLATRTYESVAPLLLFAPAVFWTEGAGVEHRRRRRNWTVAWALVVAAAAAAAVAGVAIPSAGSYQVSALRLDLSPAGVVFRLAQQASLHLLPAVAVDSRELLSPAAPVLALILTAGALPLLRDAPPAPPRGWELRGVLLGLALAGLGWSVFVLSPAIRTAERTQFLSAPGVAVLLASLIALVTRPLPSRLRAGPGLVLAAWIAAVAGARTDAMQARWNAASLWPAQAASLRAITRAVPDLAPGTLVVLFDEQGAWPATFTFRHAIQYLYEGRAIGHVVGAEPFLYPTFFTPRGAWTDPLPDIREPWSAPPTLHRGAEIVVLSLRVDGGAVMHDAWPDALPAGAGAGYAPRERIAPARAIPARAMLDTRVR
jgi:hypothetical protein